jgi:type IV pilus assembly protein PilA
MLLKLRQRMAREESGFTLVELLVVMLILGLLAAIAIPAFFNQREKAKDSGAKEMARTAETAMETYATDNNGDYTAPTSGTFVAALNKIEPTIQITNNSKDPYLSAASSSDPKAYTLTVTSQTGNTFTITRDATTSVVSFSCATTGKAGCPTSGDWAH